jgi:hypothetical protein
MTNKNKKCSCQKTKKVKKTTIKVTRVSKNDTIEKYYKPKKQINIFY